jgi:hypothetical protein
MRLKSASFTIRDERIRVPGQKTWGNWRWIQWSNFTTIASQRMAAQPALLCKTFLPRLTEFCIPTLIRKFLRQNTVCHKPNSDVRRLLMFVISPNYSIIFQFQSMCWWVYSIVSNFLWNWHLNMARICPKIKESILIFIKILNSEFLTGFEKTPKGAHYLWDKKSSIIVRAISKLQSDSGRPCRPCNHCSSRGTLFVWMISPGKRRANKFTQPRVIGVCK